MSMVVRLERLGFGVSVTGACSWPLLMSPIGLAVYSSITNSKGVFILGLAGSMGSISLLMTLTLPNNISSLELSPAQMGL